jgi:hypothetical protein
MAAGWHGRRSPSRLLNYMSDETPSVRVTALITMTDVGALRRTRPAHQLTVATDDGAWTGRS